MVRTVADIAEFSAVRVGEEVTGVVKGEEEDRHWFVGEAGKEYELSFESDASDAWLMVHEPGAYVGHYPEVDWLRAGEAQVWVVLVGRYYDSGLAEYRLLIKELDPQARVTPGEAEEPSEEVPVHGSNDGPDGEADAETGGAWGQMENRMNGGRRKWRCKEIGGQCPPHEKRGDHGGRPSSTCDE